uniref:Uncharacterized protein n=1 Tax=Chlamydomonas euryale TaxID=1486919 RepID=A0A7R9VK82_9CHLO|mmetsp:Transcript_36385/g.107417  ORF Transcript_36385/g.107417 Transcript_36385/m.107417 type:complete len:335 (+) Transcript_36385:423-1427(+)
MDHNNIHAVGDMVQLEESELEPTLPVVREHSEMEYTEDGEPTTVEEQPNIEEAVAQRRSMDGPGPRRSQESYRMSLNTGSPSKGRSRSPGERVEESSLAALGRRASASIPMSLKRLSYGIASMTTGSSYQAGADRSSKSSVGEIEPESMSRSPSEGLSRSSISNAGRKVKGYLTRVSGRSSGSSPNSGKVAGQKSHEKPLCTSSVPQAQAYPHDASAPGVGKTPPNLRRGGYYMGLIGGPRTHSNGGAEDASTSCAATEHKQTEELKGWLKETREPWVKHSSRLLKLRAHELMEEEAEREASEAKAPAHATPLKPPKKQLKTFSLAAPQPRKYK